MPRPVVPHTTYNSIRAGRIPSVSSTRTPSFPPASISKVLNMSTTHQPTPDPSVNPPQLSANPSAGPSTAPSAVPPTRNPQPIDATMMANDINDLVKPNLPSRVKIREPNPFDSSNPKKLHTFLLQCKLNFRDRKDLFQDETAKVNYVLSYLKGSALDCFKWGGGGVVVASQWLDSQFRTIIPTQVQTHQFNSPSLHEFQHLPIRSLTTPIVQHQA